MKVVTRITGDRRTIRLCSPPSKRSNQPWYILPAYAQMLARQYSFEQHLASLRKYSMQY
jgi:hypothetical protein